MSTQSQMWMILSLTLCWVNSAIAGPYVSAGDTVLRHDIQVLADHGVIRGPVSTWPLAWGPVLSDLNNADSTSLSPAVLSSYLRVRERARWETRDQELTVRANASVSDNRARIRSFQNTPRGRAEAGAGIGWLGDFANIELNAQFVDDSLDDDEVRLDDSMIGVVFGNWSVSASTQQRWWGPGWDGSVILSNNARPIPSLVIDRVFTDPFETKWLSWLGPWDLNVMMGQLESDRVVPDARFFGMRFNFRPLKSLEIGLSRTAQWCGEGRPCDLATFGDLLIGRDNRGGEGIDISNEPGNQLAGVDFRWSTGLFGSSVGFYGQFVGEDEAGGFPSRWLGQVGGEWSGYVAGRWSTRAYAEFAGTSCQFYESSELFNCAYNHSIYRTGYRYRNSSVGHGADNDARLVSLGAVAVNEDDTQWRALVRLGDLNRGGAPDSRNTLTPTPQDLFSVDVSHSRVIPVGVIDVGIGYESIDDIESGRSISDTRLYLQWRSSY